MTPTRSIDEFLSTLEELYSRNDLVTLRDAIMKRRNDGLHDHAYNLLDILTVFDGFIDLREGRCDLVIHNVPPAIDRLLEAGEQHYAARASFAVCQAHRILGNLTNCIDWAKRFETLAEKVGSIRGRVNAMSEMVYAYVYSGQMDRADEISASLLSVADNQADAALIVTALESRILLLSRTGRTNEAIDLSIRLTDLASGDQQVTGLFQQATLLSRIGRNADAREVFERLIASYTPTSELRIGAILHNYANTLLSLGDVAAAYEQFHRALATETGGILPAYCHNGLATIHAMCEEYDAARNHFQISLDILPDSYKDVRADFLVDFGRSILRTGDVDSVEQYCQQAEVCITESTNLMSRAHYLLLKGLLAFHRGKDATSFLTAAREIYSNSAMADHIRYVTIHLTACTKPSVESATVLLELADEAEALGAVTQALDALQQTRTMYEVMGMFREALAAADRAYKLRDVLTGQNQARRRAIVDADSRIKIERELAERHRHLLTTMLPEYAADRLLSGERRVADVVDIATVVFIDIVGFTQFASNTQASDVVDHLERIFSAFDDIYRSVGMIRIKTIGDAYVACGGLDSAFHVADACRSSLDVLRYINEHMPAFQVRIGLHAGTIVAGVIGGSRPAFDVWGDTVNIASRLESSGRPQSLHVAKDTVLNCSHCADLSFESRGSTSIKGIGAMETYWCTFTT